MYGRGFGKAQTWHGGTPVILALGWLRRRIAKPRVHSETLFQNNNKRVRCRAQSQAYTCSPEEAVVLERIAQ
jgi:hypothetical protein